MDRRIPGYSFTLGKKQEAWFLFALVASALVLRLMIAYTSVHYFDLSYYVGWSAGVEEDFFGAYNNIGNLDSPPLFLFPLFLTGKLLALDAVASFDPYAMLALKGWQMLFDLAIIPLLYLVLKKVDRLAALGCAALWAVNPTAIFNSSYWGQTDCIMMFLLVLAFWLLTERRPVPAGGGMTLACLMKFQSLYFAPLFALALLTMRFPWKRVALAAGAGMGTALAVFFPFMVRSGWNLPWKIYFGGFEQYPGAALNAFNLYSALGANFSHVDTVLYQPVTAGGLSAFMLAASLAALVAWYFTAAEKSVWLLGFAFMQTIFLFTARMHERYQIPVLIFALIASVCHKSRALFAGYLALTGMTFLNHFLVFEQVFAGAEKHAWMVHFDEILRNLSFVNLVLYFVLLAVVLHISYRRVRFRFAHPLRMLRAGRRRRRGNPPPPVEA
ncbi:DUF2029 domain-containing protein [Anaerotruncus sp. AF02-27]|uniref:glycosyltransferase 87 family protein n=1 Tax=Anaerotruncus sp. AF02-27 TaxID=2292191 RepID=UPI000E4CFC6F|nr:glycosyltransferase 87 family protein [Anaerotruncus sp. AF02-27]RGX55420.1 DUF2029 domain-containing protein [Anaerotruncus sp. AF02-27]